MWQSGQFLGGAGDGYNLNIKDDLMAHHWQKRKKVEPFLVTAIKFIR